MRTLQLLAVRSNRGPLRFLWAGLYELLTRLLAAYLRRGLPATVYLKGSFGRGEPVFGLSDLGLVAIVRTDTGEDVCAAVSDRWRRLVRALQPLSWLVIGVPVYAQPEIPELAATCFAYGDRQAAPPSLFFPAGRSIRLATLPGLWPTQDWRLVSGPDLRPEIDAADPDLRRLVAWLELQFWWRMAFRAVADPEAHWAPHLCIKLIAEPARILLWLEHGERHLQRAAVLHRALEAFPEESCAIEYALDLRRRLDRARVAPLGAVLPSFLRLSARAVGLLDRDLAPLGADEVELSGAPVIEPTNQFGTPLPLCDWLALVKPPKPEESFVIEPGRPDDALVVSRAIAHSDGSRYVTLLRDGMIFRPGYTNPAIGAINFAGSDPVSVALVAGESVARFPTVPGWCAIDTAIRALAEHRAWLRLRRPITADSSRERIRTGLAGTFSAARAALFFESASAGKPFLPLTFAATTEALAERVPRARGSVEAVYDDYVASAAQPTRASARTVDALTRVVGGLSCYGAAASSPPGTAGGVRAAGRNSG